MQLTSSNDGFLKGVSSWVVVEPIDPIECGVLDIVELTPGTTMVNDLGLEQSDDRLGEGVVVRVADAADRRLDAGLLQALSVTNREILASPVAMMNHSPGSGASPQSLIERIQDQVSMHRAGNAPADDAARKHIDDEGHVDETRPGRDVGEIGDPELIRPHRGELALDQICRIFRLVVADGGSALAPTHGPSQPKRSH